MTSPRASLARYVGDMQQIAGAELFETLDGPERVVVAWNDTLP
jgi:hypothetical protein